MSSRTSYIQNGDYCVLFITSLYCIEAMKPKINVYINILVFNYMFTFLWKFLYDIMILKSPPIYHLSQHIIGIFPRGSL